MGEDEIDAVCEHRQDEDEDSDRCIGCCLGGEEPIEYEPRSIGGRD
jgi:hypothetical protein